MGVTVEFQKLLFTKVEICLPTPFMGLTVFLTLFRCRDLKFSLFDFVSTINPAFQSLMVRR
jgi:hypothetical protein